MPEDGSYNHKINLNKYIINYIIFMQLYIFILYYLLITTYYYIIILYKYCVYVTPHKCVTKNMVLHYNIPSSQACNIHRTGNKCPAVPRHSQHKILLTKKKKKKKKKKKNRHWCLSSDISVNIPQTYFQKNIYYILLSSHFTLQKDSKPQFCIQFLVLLVLDV
jgi:hypothetical protein